MKITFYYVRHGKTLFNEMGRMQGMCDSPLLPEGIEGAVNTSSALRKVPFASCYCSSSERAWDTAKIICEPHHIIPKLMKELREFDFGSLDGKFLEDVKKEKGNTFTREDWSEFGGDTTSSFDLRSRKAFEQMIHESHDGDTVLVVGHGAYIMHLMETMLCFDRDAYIEECNKQGRMWMPNCGICIFSWNDGIWHMEQTPVSGDEYRQMSGAKKLIFTYVRHGETQFNKEGRMQGWCDSPLTENGIAQAENAGRRLADVHFDRAYVSTLERARDTAEIILKNHDISYSTDKRLKEVYFGKLEGGIDQLSNPVYREKFESVSFGDLGGEDYEQVTARIQSFMNSVIDEANDGDSILLVSHGMMYFIFLRYLFCYAMQAFWKKCTSENRNPIPNCGICTFTYENGQFRMLEEMK